LRLVLWPAANTFVSRKIVVNTKNCWILQKPIRQVCSWNMITELGAEICSGGRQFRACNNEHTSLYDRSQNSHRAVEVCLIVTERGTVLLLPMTCRWLANKLQNAAKIWSWNATTNDATTNEYNNEKLLLIKWGSYNERGGVLSANVARACS